MDTTTPEAPLPEHTLYRPDQPDLSFRSTDEWAERTPENCGRWEVINVYLTPAGKYITQHIARTCWQGENDTHTVTASIDIPGLVEALGQGDLAKEIYAAMNITNVVRLA